MKNHGDVHDEFIRNRIWISERSRKVWPSKGEVKNCESVHAGSSRGKFYNWFLITHTHTHTHARAHTLRLPNVRLCTIIFCVFPFPMIYTLLSYIVAARCSRFRQNVTCALLNPYRRAIFCQCSFHHCSSFSRLGRRFVIFLQSISCVLFILIRNTYF